MRFAGYAAIFDSVDRGGDIVRRGAFARAPATVPLLRAHNPRAVIGTIDVLAEDARGLRVIATLNQGETVRPGNGLSFGYRVCAMHRGTYRELTDIELIEISLVAQPMQPLATVIAVAP